MDIHGACKTSRSADVRPVRPSLVWHQDPRGRIAQRRVRLTPSISLQAWQLLHSLCPAQLVRHTTCQCLPPVPTAPAKSSARRGGDGDSSRLFFEHP